MQITKEDIVTKIHLVISVIIVIPVSFVYGFSPGSQFDINLGSIDERNFFKAIMVLYLGFSFLWVLGIFKHKFLNLAIVTNLIFMLSLGLGRLLSLALDGLPTFGYKFGTFAELFLGFYGLWVLNSKYFKKP